MGNEKPKVVIEDAILYIRKCVINPEIILQHIQMLESEVMANYVVDRHEIITYTIPATSKSFRKDNVFLGKVPKSMIFGMVSNEAYNGSYAKNPFYFQHFNLNYMVVYVNGDSIPISALYPWLC